MWRGRYSEDNRSSLPSASQIRFRYSESRASSLNNDTPDIVSLQRDSQLFSTSRDHFYDAVSVPLAIPGIGGRSSHTSLSHDLMTPREDSDDGIDVGDAIIALNEPLNGGRRAAEPPGPMVGMTFQLAMIALVIALGTSQLGFNISVINVYTWSNNCNVPIEEGVENECLVFHGHSTYEWSVVASIYAVGGIFGAPIGARLSDIYGRKPVIILGTILNIIGGLIEFVSPNIETFQFGRFVLGFAIGLGSLVRMVYIGEIAPAHSRGFFGACLSFGISVGSVIANSLVFVWATADSWRYFFGLTSVFAAVTLFMSPFLVESPRWLASQRRLHEAKATLRNLRGLSNRNVGGNRSALEREIFELELAQLETTAKLADQALEQSHGNGKSGGVLGFDYRQVEELMRPPFRRLFLISLFVLTVPQICGARAAGYYSSDFFGDGFDSRLATLLYGIVTCFASLIAMPLMDILGRRLTLLLSTAGVGISMLMLSAGPAFGYENIGVTGLMLLALTYRAGQGPVPPLFVAEVFPARLRTMGVAIATLINGVLNIGLVFGFPLMFESLGRAGTFLPFAGICAICFFILWKVIPETKGRSLEEIQADLGFTEDIIIGLNGAKDDDAVDDEASHERKK